MAKKKKVDSKIRKSGVHKLSIVLNDKERVDFANLALRSSLEQGNLEAEYDRAKKDYKKNNDEYKDAILEFEKFKAGFEVRIFELEMKFHKYRTANLTGKIDKEVRCEQVFDLKAKTVSFEYEGSVYQTTPMSDSDFIQMNQKGLFENVNQKTGEITDKLEKTEKKKKPVPLKPPTQKEKDLADVMRDEKNKNKKVDHSVTSDDLQM